MPVQWNDGMLPEIRAALMRGLVRFITDVHDEAIRLIESTEKTGRVYDWIGTTKDDERREFLIHAPQGHRFWARPRSIAHQASAPGEAPATDSGRLVQSAQIGFSVEELSAWVNFGAPYAGWLEYGTDFMEPRPYARPALANKMEAGLDSISYELRQVIA